MCTKNLYVLLSLYLLLFTKTKSQSCNAERERERERNEEKCPQSVKCFSKLQREFVKNIWKLKEENKDYKCTNAV